MELLCSHGPFSAFVCILSQPICEPNWAIFILSHLVIRGSPHMLGSVNWGRGFNAIESGLTWWSDIPASAAHLCPPALLMLTLDIPLTSDDGFLWAHLTVELGRCYTSNYISLYTHGHALPLPGVQQWFFKLYNSLLCVYTFAPGP